MAEVADSIIAEIDIQILALVKDPSKLKDYKIGDKEVDRSVVLKELRATRDFYTELLVEKTPEEDTRLLAELVDDFGKNNSEYIGEPDVEGSSAV